MKTRTPIKNLGNYIGQEVVVSGFAQVIRNQGKIGFILIRDITGTVQSVVIQQHLVDLLSKITTESVVKITGNVKAEKQAPNGFEVEAKEITILSDRKSVV